MSIKIESYSNFNLYIFMQYIKTMLKGNFNICWEISPNNEMKKRDDMLKRFAVLSVDVLRTSAKPCPLILLEVST